MIELATEVRWQETRFSLPMERILLSEELGYDAVFTAEVSDRRVWFRSVTSPLTPSISRSVPGSPRSPAVSHR